MELDFKRNLLAKFEDLCSRIGLRVEQNESWYRVVKNNLTTDTRINQD